MLFRRPAKPRPRKREALSAQQTETGGGLTPMLYLERWGNMTNKLTPSRLASILQAADDGDITEQHVLFADMEDRCEHLAGRDRQAQAGIADARLGDFAGPGKGQTGGRGSRRRA